MLEKRHTNTFTEIHIRDMYIITSSGNRYEDLINAVSQTDQLRNFSVEIENRYKYKCKYKEK